MSLSRKIWILVFGVIILVNTGIALRLTVNPLSTTEPASSTDNFNASLCLGGNGTNTEIKQWAIPYLLRHGFTENFVCNGTIDSKTYTHTFPYDLYALSMISLACIGFQVKRRRQAKF